VKVTEVEVTKRGGAYDVEIEGIRALRVHVGPSGRPWMVRKIPGMRCLWSDSSGQPLPGPASRTGKAVAAVDQFRAEQVVARG
jgi:hypothetical protein